MLGKLIEDERRHVRVSGHAADRHVRPDPLRLLQAREVRQPALDGGTGPLAEQQGAEAEGRGHRVAPPAVRLLRAGDSTGYGRGYVAKRDRWIGIVPVGYADGFRRDLTRTKVLVDGEACRVVGAVSMDAFAVKLHRESPVGTPVTIVGDGLLLEAHARVAGTITYELACGIDTSPERARRALVEA